VYFKVRIVVYGVVIVSFGTLDLCGSALFGIAVGVTREDGMG
jgi:hypothetical protein